MHPISFFGGRPALAINFNLIARGFAFPFCYFFPVTFSFNITKEANRVPLRKLCTVRNSLIVKEKERVESQFCKISFLQELVSFHFMRQVEYAILSQTGLHLRTHPEVLYEQALCLFQCVECFHLKYV